MIANRRPVIDTSPMVMISYPLNARLQAIQIYMMSLYTIRRYWYHFRGFTSDRLRGADLPSFVAGIQLLVLQEKTLDKLQIDSTSDIDCKISQTLPDASTWDKRSIVLANLPQTYLLCPREQCWRPRHIRYRDERKNSCRSMAILRKIA